MNLKTVVVIIPTYNEALVIEKTIHEVFHAMSDSAMDVHVLIFDSCSTDQTQQIVQALQTVYPLLHLLTEPQKTGLGSAYHQAMNFALHELSADVLIEFDADLSHQPHYLPEMIKNLGPYDVVMGSRYVRGGSIPGNWGWHRKVLSVLGNVVARTLLTPRYKDFTSGFRVTHANLLKKALPSCFLSQNYAYKLELLWRLHKAKAKILEYPIEFVDREQGQSKLPANSVMDSLKVLGLLRYQELKPYLNMCAVGLIGLLVQCVAYNVLRFKFAPFLAAQIAVFIAIINNFVLHHKVTFRQRNKKNHFKIMAYFITYSLFMIAFQSRWTQVGVYYWGTGFLKENLILASGIVLGSVLNYLVYSRIIWRNKKEPAQEVS
ncbi:MAG: glycosyl transferase [Legionella sp.]|nr:MAG: glycosyl transferase [Legionella sp.]PJD97698.1 MAG: glycosyl transferase [Legionella sp.]